MLNNCAYLSLLLRLLFSLDIDSLDSNNSSRSRCILRFWCFSRLISSSASSICRLSVFTLALLFNRKTTHFIYNFFVFVFNHTFSTCSLYWSTVLLSSSNCITISFIFFSNLRLAFCCSCLSLIKSYKYVTIRA